MSKKVLVMAVLTLMVLMSASVNAGDFDYGTLYPNGDGMVIYSRDAFDGYHHLVVTNNAQDGGTSATVLTPDGVPSNSYGYYYYWAEPVNPDLSAYVLYGSNNGVKWYYIGTFEM